MFNLKSLFTAALIAGSVMFVQPANAISVTGVAVGAIGDNPFTQEVGLKENRAIGNDAIKYFIPLGDTSGTYGVAGFGLAPDSGDGGGLLTMILAFAPVNTSVNGVLTVLFEDLDLVGGNDPTGFLETVEVFDAGGTTVTGPITNLGGLVTGDSDSQTLTVNVGALVSNPYYLQLVFSADSPVNGTNTAEFLIASLDNPDGTVGLVPLPAALPLYGTGLAVMGFIGWRRRQKSKAA